jgi:hypothetical protein
MTKYRNPKHEQEALELEQLEQEQNFMAEPASSAEDEVWKKRYGDLRRHADQVQNETKTRMAELEQKLEQALRGQLKAPKSDEDVELWMREYPEFAGILETIVQKRIREATSQTEAKIAKVELKQKELDAQEAFMLLRDLHPDLNDLLAKDSHFRKWLDKQPEKYKNKMNGLDVEEASLVISKYKAENKKSTKSKVDEDDYNGKDAAKVVRNRSTVEEPDADAGDYEFSESQVQKNGNRWYIANEDAIESAIRRGKFLYDISGGAR